MRKFLKKKIEVPWDLFGVGRGPNSAPGHSRISPIGDFSHLWDEVLYHGSGFCGLGFGTQSHFGSHVNHVLK